MWWRRIQSGLGRAGDEEIADRTPASRDEDVVSGNAQLVQGAVEELCRFNPRHPIEPAGWADRTGGSAPAAELVACERIQDAIGARPASACATAQFRHEMAMHQGEDHVVPKDALGK